MTVLFTMANMLFFNKKKKISRGQKAGLLKELNSKCALRFYIEIYLIRILLQFNVTKVAMLFTVGNICISQSVGH